MKTDAELVLEALEAGDIDVETVGTIEHPCEANGWRLRFSGWVLSVAVEPGESFDLAAMLARMGAEEN